jgi:regulator of replication initiation timing
MSDTPESQKDVLDQVLEQDNSGTTSPARRKRRHAPSGSSNSGKHHSASVFTYLAIMFAAAFLMLLLAYFIQQRNNSVAISGLQSSLDQFQSMDDLLSENRTLREENQTLQTENESLQQQLNTATAAEEQLESNSNELQSQNESWALFWQIDSLYRAEQYEECAQQISALSDVDGYETPDAALDRAQEIADTLLDMGYLDETTYSLFSYLATPEENG